MSPWAHYSRLQHSLHGDPQIWPSIIGQTLQPSPFAKNMYKHSPLCTHHSSASGVRPLACRYCSLLARLVLRAASWASLGKTMAR